MGNDGGPKKNPEAEIGVLSSFHSNNDHGLEIPGVTEGKASIPGQEAEFQEVLKDIDFNISKFDTPVVGPRKNGPMLEEDQPKCLNPHSGVSEDGPSIKVEEDTGQNSTSQGVELRGRGWKRVVQERHLSEAQSVNMQKKRTHRDVEEGNNTISSRKKCCVLPIHQIPTTEAAGQPRRDQ